MSDKILVTVVCLGVLVFMVMMCMADIKAVVLSCSSCKKRKLKYVGSDYHTDIQNFLCKNCGAEQTR